MFYYLKHKAVSTNLFSNTKIVNNKEFEKINLKTNCRKKSHKI